MAAKQADGSFSYQAGVAASDPDSTAQVMQGLMLLGDTYAAEIQGAADWLKAQMNEDGAILNWGAANPSSLPPRLDRLLPKGRGACKHNRKTLFDGMMTFALPDGSFRTPTGRQEFWNTMPLPAASAFRRW